MKKRILTGLILGVIVIGFFLLRGISNYIFDIFIASVVLMSSVEVSKTFDNMKKYNNQYIVMCYPLFSYLTYVLSIYFTLPLWAFALVQVVLFGVLMILCYVIQFFNVKETKWEMQRYKLHEGMSINKFATKKMLNTASVMLYPVLILSFMFLINHVPDITMFESEAFAGLDIGLFALILLVLSTVATDTFAYFVGTLIKGKKLCPAISPNKTIAGAIGGFIGGVLVSVCVFAVFNSIPVYEAAFFNAGWAIWHFLFYGIFASIIVQCGDIFASLLKRKAGVKDFGNVFPGHGGFMDRVDGMSFNAPFTFLFIALLLL